MQGLSLRPFYVRLADAMGGPLPGRALICVVPAIGFLAACYGLTDESAPGRGTCWLLALILLATPALLFHATASYQLLLERAGNLLPAKDSDTLRIVVTRTMSTRRLVLAGSVFAASNVAIGLALGPPFDGPAWWVAMAAYALAGFEGGVVMGGIASVLSTVGALAILPGLDLDERSPDRCAGVAFVGDVLAQFAGSTLLGGLLISSYILFTPWTSASAAAIDAIRWGWAVLPYAASVVVLLVPLRELNERLGRFQSESEIAAKARVRALHGKLAGGSLTVEARRDLREQLDFWTQYRETVHGIHTWPYDFRARLRFAGVLLASLIATGQSLASMLSQIE